MNLTRRSLLTKIIGALCAIPFIGKAFTKPASATVVTLQHTAFETPKVCLVDLCESPDLILSQITNAIQVAVQSSVDDCNRDRARLKRVDVRWMNIRHEEFNRDGKIGFVRVIATREINEPWEVVDARHADLRARGFDVIG